tara:strand:- start:38 stop:193 length:156 start_codon:yes stop_codon:yes gene_type:complete
MFYARLFNEHGSRLFKIIDYKDGMYMVDIDFIFPIKLKHIIYRQPLEKNDE